MPKQLAQNSLAFTREQIDLIKATVAKGATDAELQLFLYTAKRTGLDPLIKQIHAVKRWDSSLGRDTMSIQTGIDGYSLIAERTGKLAGIDDAAFDREDKDRPSKATVTVYKLVNGEPRAFTASARWNEYVALKKDGQPMAMWRKMPYLMLGKCAEALALRKAFPADLTGIYTFEEESQDGVTDVPVAKPVIPQIIPPEEPPPSAEPPEPTRGPFDPPPPKPAAPKRTRTKLQPKAQTVQRPNQVALIALLDKNEFTRGDFMAVADKNEWLGKGRHWNSMDDVPDDMFSVFLADDEFEVVLAELKKFRA